MTGKNNDYLKLKETSNEQNRFSIRKLTIGVVSVALSICMWSTLSLEKVQADSNDSQVQKSNVTQESIHNQTTAAPVDENGGVQTSTKTETVQLKNSVTKTTTTTTNTDQHEIFVEDSHPIYQQDSTLEPGTIKTIQDATKTEQNTITTVETEYEIPVTIHVGDNKKFKYITPENSIETHAGANEGVPSLNLSKITLNWTDENGNNISQPAGTQVTWYYVPDTTKITISETGTLKIKFADGTSTFVKVLVFVLGATREYYPQSVNKNDPDLQKKASSSVNTSAVDHFGISNIDWAKTPDTTTLGTNKPGTVRIHYSDGTYQDLDVVVNVVSQNSSDRATTTNYMRTYSSPSMYAQSAQPAEISANDVTEIDNSEDLSFIKKQEAYISVGDKLSDQHLEDFIDLSKLPTSQFPADAHAEFVWDQPTDTSKANDIKGHIKITYYRTTLNHTQTSKHKIIAWNDGPVHKYVTRTIHYQGAGDQTPDDEVETVDLSRTATFDGHGGFTWTAWVADGSFKRVETPQIIGYTADKNVVESYTPTATDSDFTVTVTYTPNTNPDIPGETPDIPKKPDNHPKDDKPKKPDQPVKKPTKSVAKKQNNQKLIKKQATMSPRTRKTAPNTNSVRKHAQASLPQTGSHSGLASTIFGSLAILLGLSAFLYRDKKKRN